MRISLSSAIYRAGATNITAPSISTSTTLNQATSTLKSSQRWAPIPLWRSAVTITSATLSFVGLLLLFSGAHFLIGLVFAIVGAIPEIILFILDLIKKTREIQSTINDIKIARLKISLIQNGNKSSTILKLIKLGVFASDKSENFAHIGARMGQLEILKKLAPYPHLFKERDDGGNTPLHYAVLLDAYGQFVHLKQFENLWEVRNNKKLTPLMIAVRYFTLEEIKQLPRKNLTVIDICESLSRFAAKETNAKLKFFIALGYNFQPQTSMLDTHQLRASYNQAILEINEERRKALLLLLTAAKHDTQGSENLQMLPKEMFTEIWNQLRI